LHGLIGDKVKVTLLRDAKFNRALINEAVGMLLHEMCQRLRLRLRAPTHA
jgi:hypothetical protein